MLTIHLKRDKYGREEVHKYLYPNVHILTSRCVFSVKQFPFIKRELCEQASRGYSFFKRGIEFYG